MASYIGVDVGKKTLHVYLPIIDKSLEIQNEQSGFVELSSYITKH